jgi:hypothetical protein
VTLSTFLDRCGMVSRVGRLPVVVAGLACLGLASTASAATGEWGGRTVATNGESVTMYFSDSYPVDSVLATQWADFVTSLMHGTEIATVSIHLVPLSEVKVRCGQRALACYTPRGGTIYAPADDPEVGTSAKGVLAHEYGHHIASSRANPPFTTVDYGTKRWASYENVCARTFEGDLFPGAEDSRLYMYNPGEAFAEAYRVLNEQRLGLPEEPWSIVTTSLYPDATALSLVEQDVLMPWTANTSHRLTAKLTGKIRTRTFTVSTPYDGTVSVLPRQVGDAKVSVSLLAKGRAVRTNSFSRAAGASLSSTICGVRTYSVRVRLMGPVKTTTRTTVTLSVSTP